MKHSEKQKISVGADIGGSHIICQLFDIDKNKPVEGSKLRLPVDSGNTKHRLSVHS